jgi:antirestriction protein ArdC
MKDANSPRQDVYTRVTDRIISALEQGVRPWHQPWAVSHAAGRITLPLRHNGVPYAGINVLMLWGAAVAAGYAAPIWMTFRQANELGAHVRKGEKASLVVYANKITRTEQTESGEDVEREIPFLKGYSVFNVEQIDDLPDHYYAQPAPRFDTIERIAHAEAFFKATGIDIRYGGGRAFYTITHDYVQMPPFEAFRDATAFYSTLAHEGCHWTRHPSRLDRDFGRKRFGDEGYAMEELVAELGAAFLCTSLELTPEPREEHASYLQNWLTALRNDKRAIFHAAAHAQRAADFLHKLQPAAAEQHDRPIAPLPHVIAKNLPAEVGAS